VEVDPIGDDGDSRHSGGHHVDRDVIEQRVEARHQRRAGFEGRSQFAAQAAADAVLEEAHRWLQVGGVIGRTPEERESAGHRSIEGGQPAGQQVRIRHGVEAVDLEAVGIAERQRGGDRFRRGPMAGAGIREQKEQPFH